uniref:Immunoglobulin V-set domain-containing protein n=1 Tax=Terrapene triunguis TaxID=2587831 RepID=A0A674K215_9SAUR
MSGAEFGVVFQLQQRFRVQWGGERCEPSRKLISSRPKTFLKVNFSKTAIFPFPLPHPQTVRVSAVDVKTPEELFVANGTEARLPCPFSSSEVISSATSVSWSFQPEGATTSISVRALCLG